MKKIRILLSIVACLMGFLILVSCNDATPPEQETAHIYDIFYTSNGDGTCYVHKITVNKEQNEPFLLKVPKLSPEGDVVTAIKCEPFANLIPQLLTEEEYNRLVELLKEKYNAGEITFQERDTLRSVYNKCNIEYALCGKNNPETVNNPMIYVYKNHVIEGCVITDVPDTKISNVFVNIAGYTPKTVSDGYDAIREKVKSMKSPDCEAMLEALSAFTVPDNLGTYISEIRLPDSVKEISGDFYSSCGNLTTVDLPNSLTVISTNMFSNLTKLESISIPNSVTTVGYHAFTGCTALRSVYIPNGVTQVGDLAFANCAALRTIVLPKSLTKVGFDSFVGLKDCAVYYEGSREDWEAIKPSENEQWTTRTIYFYSKTQPTENGHYWHYVNGNATAW